MNIKLADGVEGCLLMVRGTFRVYSKDDDTFKDYKICHSDLFVKIDDSDAYFYEEDENNMVLDHSPATLGKTNV